MKWISARKTLPPGSPGWVWIVVGLSVVGGLCGQAQEAGADPVILTNIQEVLHSHRPGIPFESAPVRLQGVITYMPADEPDELFLHDGSAGVHVGLKRLDPTLRVGQLVVVEGRSQVNQYGPLVLQGVVTHLGEAPLPTPKPARYSDLAKGLGHADWVEVTGSVLDVILTRGKFSMLIGSGEVGFNPVFNQPVEHLPEELLNAQVRIKGVCYTLHDPSARPIGFFLLVASNDWMRVEVPASSNRFDRPLRTVRNLQDRGPVSDERFLMRGVVTYASLTGWFVIQDETGCAQVELLRPIPTRDPQEQHVARAPEEGPRAGDWVELVASHARPRAHAPVVHWADYRVLGRTNLTAPSRIAVADMNDSDQDCRRVTVKARVVHQASQPNLRLHLNALVLQSGGIRFDAVLNSESPEEFAVQPGDLVEVTGLCTTRAGGRESSTSARVFLGSVSDVRVLAAPPVWLTGPALRVVAGAGGALALTLLWVAVLRRQVGRQTKALRLALSREQELNQLKTNFVSMVSHEFRTPLGVIVSSVDILRRYLDRLDPETRRHQFDIILNSTGTLANLIEDLLLLGKVEAGKLTCQPAPFDLASLCRHLVDEVLSATQRVCPIDLRLAGDLAGAVGDEGLVRPALSNLLSNAVKYSTPGSTVDFHVSREGADALFVVIDHGIGIPESEQDRLFEAFSRASNVGHRQGTGLGLVIARRCVELHGGHIRFRSVDGAGTTFTIRLPLFDTSDNASP